MRALREFAKLELKEKRAARVCVRKVRMESTLRRGWLPDLVVREVRGTHYLVCVFRGSALRVYCMGKGGEPLGAEDFSEEKMDKVWSKILKKTKNLFCLPK